MKVKTNVLVAYTKVKNRCTKTSIFVVLTNMTVRHVNKVGKCTKSVSTYEYIVNCERIKVLLDSLARLVQYDYRVYGRVVSGGSRTVSTTDLTRLRVRTLIELIHRREYK